MADTILGTKSCFQVSPVQSFREYIFLVLVSIEFKPLSSYSVRDLLTTTVPIHYLVVGTYLACLTVCDGGSVLKNVSHLHLTLSLHNKVSFEYTHIVALFTVEEAISTYREVRYHV